MGAALTQFFMSAVQIMLAPFMWLFYLLKDWTAGRLSTRARWTLEISLVLVTAGILALLNWKLGLARYLTGPPALRKVWLGLLLILSWLTFRFSLFLWRQLPRRQAEFGDIRNAVQAGCLAAMDARIQIQDSPLFLVIGADELVEQSIAESSFVGDRLQVTDPTLPAHWLGDAEAIWLSIPGISAVSAQTRRTRTPMSAARPAGGAAALRLSVVEKERAAQRMRYLIKLLRKVRDPVVPVNGVVLLVPLQWMQDPTFSQFVDTIKIDMQTAQEELGVKCTCLVLVHGIEESPEFSAYRDSMPEAARQRRCGCTLPMFAEHTEADSGALHDWLGKFFRQQVFRFYQSDRQRPLNGRLFRFLWSFREARDGFCRVMNHAFAGDIQERFYLGGVYFTELNRSRRTFFDGIAAKLTSDHDEMIGWNDAAHRRDRRLRQLATLAAGLVVALLTIDAVRIGSALFLR